MQNSRILVMVSRLLFPFVVMFGLYIIVNGSLSPGGGFQGGAILATAILTTFFAQPTRTLKIKKIILLEKSLFLLLVILLLAGYFLGGEFFMNLTRSPWLPFSLSSYLVFLNLLIGLKVALGLTAIVYVFYEEGR